MFLEPINIFPGPKKNLSVIVGILHLHLTGNFLSASPREVLVRVIKFDCLFLSSKKCRALVYHLKLIAHRDPAIGGR